MAIQFGFGGFPEFLTPNSLGNGGILLSRIPSVSDLLAQTKHDLKETLSSFDSFDYVVFRLSGENPNELIQLLRIHGLLEKFRSRSYSAAFWTMDSHHLGAQEAKAAKHFDHVFVAHRQYINLFDPTKSSYMPCSYSLSSSSDVARHLADAPSPSDEKIYGVCAPFAAYPWQRRNRSYAHMMSLVESLGIQKFFFGTVRGGYPPNDALIRKLLQHKVVINLSLSDDLNMRNFEALSMNRILLTNRVLDHGLLAEWEENIVYIPERRENFEDALLEALSRTPKEISSNFLTDHSIESRVFMIVEELVGSSPNTQAALNSGLFDKPISDTWTQTSVGETERRHTQINLLAKSGWFSIRDLIHLWEEGNAKRRALLEFFATWGVSFAHHVVRSTLGRSSMIRAIVRTIKMS